MSAPDDRYRVGKILSERLGLPDDPEEGFVYDLVDNSARALVRLDSAEEAWRYLEPSALRAIWFVRGNRADHRDDPAARREAEWYWRCASMVLCTHTPKGSACEGCLGQGRGSLNDEAYHEGFPPVTGSPFVVKILKEVLTPYLEARPR
jgi:hypothetical protein